MTISFHVRQYDSDGSFCQVNNRAGWYRVPPSPLVYKNHEVTGEFWTWSLKHKDLYQSIPK